MNHELLDYIRDVLNSVHLEGNCTPITASRVVEAIKRIEESL
jgi:hypothetical protein